MRCRIPWPAPPALELSSALSGTTVKRRGIGLGAENLARPRVLSARSFIPASSKVFELQVRFTLFSVRERRRVRKKAARGDSYPHAAHANDKHLNRDRHFSLLVQRSSLK